jgi:hypothetical protein
MTTEVPPFVVGVVGSLVLRKLYARSVARQLSAVWLLTGNLIR